MHFDAGINLGQVLTMMSMLFLAIVAWRDMSWRVKNLEIWRGEHMIDSDARDSLIRKLEETDARLEKILIQVRWQTQKMGGVPARIEEQYKENIP